MCEEIGVVARVEPCASDRAAKAARAAGSVPGGPVDLAVAELDVEIAGRAVTAIGQDHLERVRSGVAPAVEVVDVVPRRDEPSRGAPGVERVVHAVVLIVRASGLPRVHVREVRRDHRRVARKRRRRERGVGTSERQVAVRVDEELGVRRPEEVQAAGAEDRSDVDRAAGPVVVAVEDLLAVAGETAEVTDRRTGAVGR